MSGRRPRCTNGDQFLDAIENLSRFHREHEKFYAQRPREQAVALQRHSRALSALADRWEHVDAQRVEALSPYQGADDLDGPRRAPRLLHSAVELIDHAADLLSDSAGLVQDNERRWRTFHQRVIELF